MCCGVGSGSRREHCTAPSPTFEFRQASASPPTIRTVAAAPASVEVVPVDEESSVAADRKWSASGGSSGGSSSSSGVSSHESTTARGWRDTDIIEKYKRATTAAAAAAAEADRAGSAASASTSSSASSGLEFRTVNDNCQKKLSPYRPFTLHNPGGGGGHYFHPAIHIWLLQTELKKNRIRHHPNWKKFIPYLFRHQFRKIKNHHTCFFWKKSALQFSCPRIVLPWKLYDSILCIVFKTYTKFCWKCF